MSRARIRCLHVSGENFTARVQTVEGEELSPESMKALLDICAAAADKLAAMPEPAPEAKARLKKLSKRVRRLR